jgi:hypothetical protein
MERMMLTKPTRRGFLLGVAASSSALFAIKLPTLHPKWASAALTSNYGQLTVRLITPATISDQLPPLPPDLPAWSPLQIKLPRPTGKFFRARPNMRKSTSDFLDALDQGPLILSGWLLPELIEQKGPMLLCLPLFKGQSYITARMIKVDYDSQTDSVIPIRLAWREAFKKV